MKIKIKHNGKIKELEIKAKKFAFDGCHKIYLLESLIDEEEAKNEEYNIFKIEKLPKIWEKSCDLRFINTWNLRQIVKQFSIIEFNNKQRGKHGK